jgi:hypothetical protein
VIVVSLLLILVSGGLLATGILQANDPFVVASIGVSVLAAAALFLGIRQQRGGAVSAGGQDVDLHGRESYGLGSATSAPAGRAIPADAGRGNPAGAVPRAGTARSQAVRVSTPARPPSRPPAPPAQPAVDGSSIAAAAAPAVGSASVASAVGRVVPESTRRADESSVTPEREMGPASAAPDRAPAEADIVDEITATQVIDVDAVDQPAAPEPPAAAQPAFAEPPAAEPLAAEALAAEPVAAQPEEPDEPALLDEDDEDEDDDEDPPDEPAAELLMASEESRLATLDNEVLVVDGRPRYHLSGCPHLEDKESQPLPVSEAIELGFTACSLCGAATVLLSETSPQ